MIKLLGNIVKNRELTLNDVKEAALYIFSEPHIPGIGVLSNSMACL